MKFRMVDRIVAWEPRRMIRGAKTVSFEEYQFSQRLGDEACLPEVLVMESLFQLGNWLIAISSDFAMMGLVVRTEEVRWHGRLRPGERLDLEVTVRSYRDDGVLFDGRATCGGRAVAAGVGCLATPVPLADYFAPDDLRVLFSEIFRPDPAQTQEDSPCHA